ncbi:MAG: tRNA (adenosine(37)-N6)-threonylcarbamoyltransferase complex dimerization subunit type 1 TsaB [Bacteroidales bacterium]|nr:tRNA (adenosine(37)-N6)-threonylcarbamoyltransferase complex dimerization subunit type 1 TsaB [Bacteroidales bacterium]
MARILLIDTSTAVLSVGLSLDGTVAQERVCTEARSQASLTAPLVKEMLDAEGLGVKDCDAVCVSAGPGSYTGLRVGVSTAKGLAFGAGIPLIAIGTLDILAHSAVAHSDTVSVMADSDRPSLIVPMIDARRMEVYTAIYSADGERLTPVEAKVIGPESFAPELAEGPVTFIGDGALKCQEVIKHPNARFRAAEPLARFMAPLAQKAFDEGQFVDLAYFEPFYLKDFVATVSRKQLW